MASSLGSVNGFPFYDGNQQGAELTSKLKHFLDVGEPPIVFTLGSAAVLSPGNFYQNSTRASQQLIFRALCEQFKNKVAEHQTRIDRINAMTRSQQKHLDKRNGKQQIIQSMQ